MQSLASYPISRSTVPVEAPERTVLYVEDHVVNVLLMQALFAKRPAVRLEVASTAELGLRAAADHTPDLLLLDLRLPDCHGSELLQRMRALPGLANVPAIAVTAEERFELHGTSFMEVWMKPLDITRTLQRLDEVLASKAPEPVCAPEPAAAPAVTVHRDWTPSDKRARAAARAWTVTQSLPGHALGGSGLRSLQAQEDDAERWQI